MIGKGHIRCAFSKGGLSAAIKAAGGNKQLARFARKLESERLAKRPIFAARPFLAVAPNGVVMSFCSSRAEAAASAQFI